MGAPAKDRLRIVHCLRSPIGGIFRHVRDLAQAQAAAGHDVGIVCDSSTGGDFEARLIREIEPSLSLGVRRTPMQRHVGLGDLASAWRTYRIIKGLQPDVLHGHGAKGGVYSRMFGSLLRVSRSRVARVYSPHGGSLHYEKDSLTGRIFFVLEAAMGRLTDQLMFVSREERESYLRKVGKPAAPDAVVYNGVSEAEFEPVAPAAGAADFLFIGMMRDLKGPDLFIEAFALAERMLDWRLSAVMVGDGDDRDRYIASVGEAGLSDRIRFLMPMPARQAFALARTIVVPSRAEAMPYIVIEALAAGMPMIATKVGGIPEIFAGASAVLVEPDAGQIAARMAETIRDPAAFASAMPEREELRRRFSARAMADAIEQAYQKVLARTRRPA